MKAAQILREKINSNQIVTGALAIFHYWPGLVEVAMRAGLDYLIIDLEHLTHDAASVATGCSIGRMTDFPILIRPPAAEMVPLRLAMDLGSCGLLVPYVEGPETMDVIRDAIYMKPRGKRRPGGMGNLWVKDYNYSTWKSQVEDHFIVLPQIESRLGLQHVDAIARNPITTAIAVGPYDLSADLGCCYDTTNADWRAAIQRVRKAGKDAGKNMWMIGDGATLAQQGFTFLCIGEPQFAMEGALRSANQAAKSGKPADAPKIEQPLP